jgi:hypothetical protein
MTQSFVALAVTLHGRIMPNKGCQAASQVLRTAKVCIGSQADVRTLAIHVCFDPRTDVAAGDSFGLLGQRHCQPHPKTSTFGDVEVGWKS